MLVFVVPKKTRDGLRMLAKALFSSLLQLRPG